MTLKTFDIYLPDGSIVTKVLPDDEWEPVAERLGSTRVKVDAWGVQLTMLRVLHPTGQHYWRLEEIPELIGKPRPTWLDDDDNNDDYLGGNDDYETRTDREPRRPATDSDTPRPSNPARIQLAVEPSAQARGGHIQADQDRVVRDSWNRHAKCAI